VRSVRVAFEKLGVSASAARQALSGHFVEASLAPSNARELSVMLGFLVDVAPEDFAQDLDQALAIREDPDTLTFGVIDPKDPEKAFDALTLSEDAARRWLTSRAGQDINLSTSELSAFEALRAELEGQPSVAEPVSRAVRRLLVRRFRSYRTSGLAGIEPYQRSGGAVLDASAELRGASLAAKALGLLPPAFYDLLLAYPKGRPKGLEERFFWTHYRAHGEATWMLTHRLSVPQKPEFGSVQRQYYVSRGYNVEQSLSALLAVREGTVVSYTNRTSTDQVTGFGGAARRSIGRKLLGSQLEGLYRRVRQDAANAR